MRRFTYLVLCAFGAAIWPLALSAQPDVEACDTPGTAILDVTTVTDEIDVLDDIMLADTQISLDITHTFEGDMEISAESPGGTSVTLHANGGGGSDDILLTYWDFGVDNGTVAYTCDCLMKPSGPGELADYAGESTLGIWTLTVADEVGGDSGTLNEWCVRGFLVAPTFPVSDLSCSGDTSGVATVSWTNGGDYDEVQIFVNGTLDATLPGPLLDGAVETYSATALPTPQTAEVCVIPVTLVSGEGFPICCSVALPAEPFTEVTLAPDADISSTLPPWIGIFFFFDVLVLEDIQVDVNITYPFIGGLEISVTSPAGTGVTLHDQLGGFAADIDVRYWELGVPNAAPYDCGCFMQASGPGALLDFIGESITGVWVMVVTSSQADVGTVDSVTIAGYDVGPAFAVGDLSCDGGVTAGTVDVSWTNTADYDEINVYVNGVFETTLAGPFVSGTGEAYATLAVVPPVVVDVCVEGVKGGAVGPQACCSRFLPEAADVEVCDGASVVLPAGTTTVSATVSEVLAIAEVEVVVSLTSDWLPDFDIFIDSPSGTQVQLHNNTGPADVLTTLSVVYDEDGVTNGAGGYDCACAMQPSGPGDLLDFEGELSDGDWDLTLTSGGTFGGGTLNEWCVRVFGCGVLPPSDVACAPSGTDVSLTWSNNDTYDAIDVLRDGAVVATLGGSETSFLDAGLAPGFYAYRISAASTALGCSSNSPTCFAGSGFFASCKDDILLAAGSPGGEDTLTFLEPIIVGDVEVLLQAAVTFTSDWDFFLTSPFGTEVQLHNNNGGTGTFDLVWSDSGAVNTGAVGSYDCDLCLIQPTGPGDLADFLGEIADGDWTLSTGGFSTTAELELWCLFVYQGCELAPPSTVSCTADGNDVDLAWSNVDTYSSIEIARNGVTIATLAGTATTYTDADVLGGVYTYRVFGVSASLACSSGSPLCNLEHLRTETCDGTSVALVTGSTTSATLTVTDPVQILEAEIYVDISFPFQAGLDLSVQSPGGTEVTMADGTSGTLPDLDVTFSGFGEPPDFTTNLSCGGCRIEPTGPGTFSDFESESSDGDWELTITDTFFSAGTLNEWCVGIFQGCAALPPTEVTCVDDGTEVDLTWSNSQTYSSISILRDGAEIATLAGTATSYSDDAVTPGIYTYRIVGFDAVLDCESRSENCEVGFAVVAVCSTPGSPIPDLSTVSDAMDVTSDVEISDTLLFLDLDHTFVSDMVITVESPVGTTVTLHDNSGGGSDDMRLTYSDSGVANGAAPYTCDCLMQPSGPGVMADFATESTLGFWTLTISDTVGADFGTLNEWCLQIFPSEVPPPAGPFFLRGDASGNGIFNALLDALFILNYQFNAGAAPPCFRAADADGNNLFNALLDALFILNFQFNAGAPPPAPGTTTCGVDPDGASEPFSCDTPDPICN